MSMPADALLDNSIGMATILGMLFAQEDLTTAWDALQLRLQRNPQDAVALHDCSQILQGIGKTAEALDILHQALALRRSYRVVHGTGRDVRLLAFVIAGDFMANTPVDFLLRGSNTTLILHYVDAGTETLAGVPDHDVALVAVAESPTSGPVLARLRTLLANWHRPVLNNRPEIIAALTRDGVPRLLDGLAEIVSPPTWRAIRATLMEIANDVRTLSESIESASFPIIIRPIGTHAGGGLDRVFSAEQLAGYLATEAAENFYIAPFVDYSGPDGRFTKLRIVQIAGRPFASHLAVSDHWIVHYLSAGMAEDPAKRAIEADWMAEFDIDFARRHADAFSALHERIGLDYFGYDCAVLPDGRLLIFEIDVAMVVHDMDSQDLYPYKKPAMRKLFEAFLDLLHQAAAGHQAALKG